MVPHRRPNLGSGTNPSMATGGFFDPEELARIQRQLRPVYDAIEQMRPAMDGAQRFINAYLDATQGAWPQSMPAISAGVQEALKTYQNAITPDLRDAIRQSAASSVLANVRIAQTAVQAQEVAEWVAAAETVELGEDETVESWVEQLPPIEQRRIFVLGLTALFSFCNAAETMAGAGVSDNLSTVIYALLAVLELISELVARQEG